MVNTKEKTEALRWNIADAYCTDVFNCVLSYLKPNKDRDLHWQDARIRESFWFADRILKLCKEVGMVFNSEPPLLSKDDIVPYLKAKYPHMYRGTDYNWCKLREDTLLVLLQNHDTELLLDAQRQSDIKHGTEEIEVK